MVTDGLPVGSPSHRVLLPVRHVLAEGEVDDIGVRLHAAVDDREVSLLDPALLELLRQSPVRGVLLGHDHHARGVPVEAVDDAGARELLAYIGEVAR